LPLTTSPSSNQHQSPFVADNLDSPPEDNEDIMLKIKENIMRSSSSVAASSSTISINKSEDLIKLAERNFLH
jgi:hypothetical protein